ncbi:MAG TPA: GNAT family protein [Candidatus Saccharimonadales bacterium]|nr:GNAT family protein [Candidatus Saccharimonadales bacterium]
MPTPNLQVLKVDPSQANLLAQPLQGFLAETWRGLYVDEIGATMNVLADPTDVAPGGAVAKQASKIAASTNLSQPDTAAYVIAHDLATTKHAGIVGMAKLVRLDAETVEIEELDTALDRRGERIGPAMLDMAFNDLTITGQDKLVIWVLKQNVRARRFWEHLGFTLTGRLEHHKDVFPDPSYHHYQYIAPFVVVQANASKRLHNA